MSLYVMFIGCPHDIYIFKPKKVCKVSTFATPSKTTWAVLAQTCVPARAVSMRAYTSGNSSATQETDSQQVLQSPTSPNLSIALISLRNICKYLFQSENKTPQKKKKHVLKCLEPKSMSKPGSPAKSLRFQSPHAQPEPHAGYTKPSAVHAMQGCLPWKGAGKEYGNNMQ